MPYPNEYAARINEPDKYKSIKRESNKFGQGIDVIWGITDKSTTEVQAIRFNKGAFSSEEVHTWLRKHKYTPINVEEPSQSSDAVQEAILYDKLGTIQVDIDQFDFVPINIKGAFETTSEGFMKFVAPVAKVGVYKYNLPDGTIRRDLVDEETLFNIMSMKSLELKPFTNEHPINLLDTETVKKHSVGSTGEKIYKDENHLMSSLVITDSEAIQDVKKGKRQLSPGYKTTLLFEPGVYNGEHYDVIQRNRVYNHLALCTKARGGDSLSLSMDNVKGDSFTNNNISNLNKGVTMLPKFCINGIDYEASQEVINHLDSVLKKLSQSEQYCVAQKDTLDKVNKSLQEVQIAFDAYKANVPNLIKQSVIERTRLQRLATLVLDSSELTDMEKVENGVLKAKMVKAKYPTLDITGKDEAYVSALVDSLENQLGETSVKDQIALLTKTTKGSESRNIVDSVKSRETYIANLKDAWQVNPRTGK
jgi:hypothetical protein